MLMSIVGLSKIEQVETHLDSSGGHLAILITQLDNLKFARHRFAHTSTKTGAIPTHDAPSVTKHNFLAVYNALREYEKALRRFNC